MLLKNMVKRKNKRKPRFNPRWIITWDPGKQQTSIKLSFTKTLGLLK